MLCGCLAKSTFTPSSHFSSTWCLACSLVSLVIPMRESRYESFFGLLLYIVIGLKNLSPFS